MQAMFRTLRNYFNDHHETSVFYGFSMLFGMLGALIIVTVTHFYLKDDVPIGTVNITGLVARFVKQEADKNLSSDALKKEVKDYGIDLNKELQNLSKDKNLILMPAEVVIAGSPDYTAYINQRLLDKEDSKNE